MRRATLTPALAPTPAAVPGASTAPLVAHAHDPSGDAVLHTLSRPVSTGAAGVVGGLLLSLLSFGVLPVLLWPLRFAKFVQRQKEDLSQLAKWVSFSTPHPSTKRLSQAVSDIEFRPVLLVIALTICMAMAATFLAVLPGATDPLYLLIGSAFRAPRGHRLPPQAVLPFVWTIGLCVAYVCQWIQVQLHARSVRKLLDVFNEVMIDEGLAPVFLEPVGFAVGPLWLLAGVLLVVLGAPWGVCLMLAGGVQNRYARRVTPRLTSQLAQRVRDMLL